MDPLAIELNDRIRESAPAVYDCLSEQGKKIFFPAGILTQGAEAKEKAHRFDATIGIAIENDEPMHLPITRKFFSNLEKKDIYPYAPPAGRPRLRELWKEKIFRSNPSLNGKSVSNPIVTAALTHGLSLVGDLFVGNGDLVLIPDKLWGVYRLNFVTRKGGEIRTFPMFNDRNGFNTEGLKQTLAEEAEKRNKVVVLLSFPNNPTGYTPYPDETDEICSILKKQAEQGTKIVTISDDAYFGLFYEDSVKESLFGRFCDLHENIIATKLDGGTKEAYVWGFRIGFITFGTLCAKPDLLYEALELKVKGLIRSTLSSCSQPAQAILEKILEDPAYWSNQNEKFLVMAGRAKKLKQILQKEKYNEVWDYYPFNSGYFMCLKLHDLKAEELRSYLLNQYGVGTIAPGESDLRIAFSCIEENRLEELFELIYQAAKELSTR